jgi:hypothetical protein
VRAGGRTPPCARCGGTGYVYLWSIPSVGPRVYYCDRSACKRFWTDAAFSADNVGNGEVTVRELPALISTTIERVLQPV